MSIFDETQQHKTITTVGRALQLFTNRLKSQRLFLPYLNDDLPRKKILFFYGDGGNGKSLLLRYLSSYCCKQFTKDNWEYIQAKTDKEFSEEIKTSREGFEIVPHSMLDFGEQPKGDDVPQQSFSALLMMQRQLSPFGFHFPLFTFACVWYLHKANKLASTNLRGIFPPEEMDLVSTLVDSLSGTTWGAIAKTVISLFSKHLKERFEIYKTKRGLNEAKVLEIQEMDVDTELMANLPRFFAEDLNAEMSGNNSHKRVVLFFDTHEALIGSERKLSDHTRFERDRWLRLLLGSLHLDRGIIPVVAGRERPFHWSHATELKIPENFLDSHLVGYITKEDATEYLKKAGLTDTILQKGLVEYSQAQEDEVHPYLLGLCADVVLAAGANNESFDINDFPEMEAVTDKARAVTDRFMSYTNEMGYTVKALCAARSFDRDIFKTLGQQLNFHTTEPDFLTLIGFSFVWSKDKEGTYRIHDLMRRLMRDLEDETTRKAHEVLEAYFRSKHSEASDNAAHAEAIYHANQLEWERGAQEWNKAFNEALENSAYVYCEILLDVRGLLLIEKEHWFGHISQSEGDFYERMSLYETAQNEYEESIAAYNRVLDSNPGSDSILNSKGIVLHKLGDLLAKLSKHSHAMDSYKDSIKAYDIALSLAPGKIGIHTNKGRLLCSLGELQEKLSKHDEAGNSYKESIIAFDIVLNQNPNDYLHHINKSATLGRLGQLKAAQSKYNEAMKSYEDSIKCLDTALNFTSDSNWIYNSKGVVLDNLGELYSRLSKYDEAEQNYKDSIVAFDKALNITPNELEIHNNRGSALNNIGELQVKLSRNIEAMSSFKASIEAYNTTLNLAPNHLHGYSNKSNVLRNLGDAQRRLSKYDEAEQSYNDSLRATNIALNLAPDYVNALNHKGKVLYSLGVLQSDLSKENEAINNYLESIKTFNIALKLAPNDVYIHNNKGLVLRILGDIQLSQSKYDNAFNFYKDSINSYGMALNIAPEYVMAYSNRGHVYRSLGDLQVNQSKYDEAEQSYKNSINNYDTALKIAPKDIVGHLAKSIVLFYLGVLKAHLSQTDMAIKYLESVIEEVSIALEISPNFVEGQRIVEAAKEMLEKQRSLIV